LAVISNIFLENVNVYTKAQCTHITKKYVPNSITFQKKENSEILTKYKEIKIAKELINAIANKLGTGKRLAPGALK
jgi:hypothetical protein